MLVEAISFKNHTCQIHMIRTENLPLVRALARLMFWVRACPSESKVFHSLKSDTETIFWCCSFDQLESPQWI